MIGADRDAPLITAVDGWPDITAVANALDLNQALVGRAADRAPLIVDFRGATAGMTAGKLIRL